MKNNELIAKISKLKNVSPSDAWLKENRELLLTQISNSGTKELSAWSLFVINLSSALRVAVQPAFALGAFVILILGASLYSHQLFNSAKPNDSLYIARIISEKAKLSVMFNETAREKMELKFAASNAQDITTALADPAFNNDENKDQVAKLNENFNEKITTVKKGIARYTATKNQVDPILSEEAISIANSLKENKNIQLSITNNDTVSAPSVLKTSEPAVLNVSNDIATTTEITPELKTVIEPEKILEEAQASFDQKDYTSALNKLKEVNEIIR